ncbi:nodal homolog 4-A-like [Bufo gargarizans]|uniref:nodal homolog 4-A-like n=1 Tax=Bufo gargarizans TaxID=30331 RepID=UPI001CF42AA2|nr:nodal homolog 4-A-like [Bufo gargarizans]
MAVYPYCILLLLLISGAICYSRKSYLGPDSGALQEYLNRTEREDSKDGGSPHLPIFMLSLYQSFHRLESRHNVDLTSSVLHGFSSSLQSDIIRSLAAKSIKTMGERCILVFDFSSLSHDEELQFAEVRIRKSAVEKPFGDGSQVIMNVFHQNSACQKPTKLCKNTIYLGKFKSALRSKASESWIVVDATEIVSKWFDISNKSGIQSEKRKERFPWPASAKNRYKEHTSEDQLVLMFVYSNASKKERSLVSASLLLDAAQSKYLTTIPAIKNITVSRRRRRSHIIRDRMIGMKQVPTADNPGNLCRRVDLIVDFKMIGWDTWIIHPKKFNAYRCEGTCPSPVNESVKPNNHSYLQSLLNFYNSRKAPEVCCVPTKMSSLSMAYYDHMDIAFQVHEAMIVEECGCQ